MGIGVENCTVAFHTQPGMGATDYQLWAHRADLGVDSKSATYTHADHLALVSAAATSEQAFHAAAGALLGAWYTGLSPGFKAGFFQNYERM
jgi:hypothetical protein